MKLYNRQEAILQINEWGLMRRPFVFIIDYKQEEVWLGEPGSISAGKIAYNFNGFTNVEQSPLYQTGNYSWEIHPQPYSMYNRSFQKVMKSLKQGDSYLVNLTCSTEVVTDLSLKDIFDHASAHYKLWIKNRFVVFSPELFVRTAGDSIFSYPMKGTIDAAIPDARQKILVDSKEAAEHATITDLIRNDLSIVSTGVTVTRYRYIEEVVTAKGPLLQVSSEIKGCLPSGWQDRPADILFPLLPAGSITGAPKKKTMEIIASSETHERGFYTGVMGYFDGKNLESAVMIRFMEEKDGKYFYKSGGGITALSHSKDEYDEVIRKIYLPFC